LDLSEISSSFFSSYGTRADDDFFRADFLGGGMILHYSSSSFSFFNLVLDLVCGLDISSGYDYDLESLFLAGGDFDFYSFLVIVFFGIFFKF